MSRPGWLAASELRIGLGCMRMSTDENRDEELALETIAAAVEAGITVFDTAHAYGRGEAELGHNERLLIAAVQVPLSLFGDRALRGGVVERCAKTGLAVMTHSLLGGPRRAGDLPRRQVLADVADARGSART
jgi:aryl-alcohol dehydrogenase-like predicted oxidoreductase